MAVKAGKVITLGNGFLVERAQSVGAPSLNIPTERIQETGNELTVAIERDIPDLSFDIESLDASIDTEAGTICRIVPSTLNDGDFISFDMAKPVDVVSPWKKAGASKFSDGGVIWPHIILSSASYRFGVGTQGASQTFSFSGDSQYSGNRTPYREEFACNGSTTVFAFANAAVKTVEEGDDLYAVGATVYYSDGTWLRLFNGEDFTSTSANITVTDVAKLPAGAVLAVCYFSATQFEFAQTIHSTPSVKPAKVKGKNINLYVGVGATRSFNAATNTDTSLVGASAAFTSADVGAKVSGAGIVAGTTIASVTNATTVVLSQATTATAGSVLVELNPPLIRWDGVQQVELNWRVTLDHDDELGNAHHVSSDYDVPELSGSITLRPASNAKLFDKIAQVTGTAVGEIANLLSTTTLELQVRLANPRTGAIIKSFRVEDAQILPPGAQARAGQKTEPQLQWSSESGYLQVFKGAPA